jgi:ribulose bisphosphate carboxylase small subunit
MKADIRGALAQINKSYSCFEHKGKRLTKNEVKKVLEYGLEKGYTTTAELSDDEVDKILNYGVEKKDNEKICIGCKQEKEIYSKKRCYECYMKPIW